MNTRQRKRIRRIHDKIRAIVSQEARDAKFFAASRPTLALKGQNILSHLIFHPSKSPSPIRH